METGIKNYFQFGKTAIKESKSIEVNVHINQPMYHKKSNHLLLAAQKSNTNNSGA